MTRYLPAGTVCIMDFDGRGLCEITGDNEDGQQRIQYLPDSARTSEHVTPGMTEWVCRADLVVVERVTA